MRVLWFSWKDRNHPQAGGAETVSGELMDRLLSDGHEVTLITASYPGSSPSEITENNLRIVRLGNRYTVYAKARRYYKKNLSTWPDMVIDEMNTMPFGVAFYAKQPTVLLTYQLAREVWFYQMPQPFSLLGYILEPLYLRLLSRRYSAVLTESESTKADLEKYGFAQKNISVFRVGMSLKPIEVLNKKNDTKIILSLGSVRPMKRTLDAIRAFEIARERDSALNMIIAGDISGSYGKKVQRYIANSPHKKYINVLGKVSDEERIRLMRETAVILVTSVKEGWGLIVTEANSQGTPAIVYDTDGLRDSVRNNETGLLVTNGSYREMGDAIINLVHNDDIYEVLRQNAWKYSQQFTFENSYSDFLSAIGK